jgi:hypothetical protein
LGEVHIKMTDKRQKILLTATLALGAVVLLLFVMRSDGASSIEPGNLVPFVPIWIAVWAAISAAQKRQKTRIKNKQEDADIYSVMKRMVRELDENELAYLKQRLIETHGDVLEKTDLKGEQS